MPAPVLHGDRIRFAADFPAVDGHPVTAVRLDLDPALTGPRDFLAHGGDEQAGRTRWQLDFPRPRVQRFEYRLIVVTAAGDRVILDPDNTVLVPTAFGERSVFRMPNYREPTWLTAPAVPGVRVDTAIAGETAEPVPVTIWSPEGLGATEPAPLMLVHDGPEYDRLAALSQYSGAMVAADRLPPHRLALAQPVLRDAWYSGSPAYLRSEAGVGLTSLQEQFATKGPVVVMGASLGGLTSLLVGLLSAGGAGMVGGVFAQSGSFFTVRHDESESRFPYFGRITRAVQEILDTAHTDHPLQVAMTCGELEENAANNQAMASALARAGHHVTYTQVPDLHNYTAWRDALDPHLTALLSRCWS